MRVAWQVFSCRLMKPATCQGRHGLCTGFSVGITKDGHEVAWGWILVKGLKHDMKNGISGRVSAQQLVLQPFLGADSTAMRGGLPYCKGCDSMPTTTDPQGQNSKIAVGLLLEKCKHMLLLQQG